MSTRDYERYKAYSEYSFESSGFKKLDYIVESIQTLNAGAPMQILELGCGNGNISTVLASFGHEVLGIDLSEDCIEYAASLKDKYNLNNLHFERGNASEIQRLGQSFDAVICSEVLEHSYDPMSILSAVHAVLKHDGILIVTVPNGYGPWEVSMKAARKLRGLILSNEHITSLYTSLSQYIVPREADIQSVNTGGEGSSHVQFFTKKSLTRLFETTGFKIINSGSSDFLSGTLLFGTVIRKSELLSRIDFALADALPSGVVSGWYFTLQYL